VHSNGVTWAPAPASIYTSRSATRRRRRGGEVAWRQATNAVSALIAKYSVEASGRVTYYDTATTVARGPANSGIAKH